MPVRKALFTVAAACIVACGTFGSSDPEGPTPQCEGGACGPDAAPAPDASTPAPPIDCLVQPASPNDLGTCKCATEGVMQGCSFGVVGPPSACLGSSQRCALTDGVLRWSACTGATKPAAKETCFDTIDDDCDGRLNNGCACVDVPLCMDEKGTELPGDALILEKTTVTRGQKISVYFVTKSNLGNTWLTTTSGANQTLCGGGGGTTPCASSGAGCTGWNVERRELDTTLNPTAGLFRAGAGTYTIRMRRGVTDAVGNCTTGANTVSAMLTIN